MSGRSSEMLCELSSLRKNGEKRTNFNVKSELPPERLFSWEMQHMSAKMGYCFASLTGMNQAVFSDIAEKNIKQWSNIVRNTVLSVHRRW